MIKQYIDLDKGCATNKATFKKLGIPFSVRVTARISARDESTAELQFNMAYFKIWFLPEIPVPIGIFKPRGTLKTTYLSNKCRVGRGDKGGIFVLMKEENNVLD